MLARLKELNPRLPLYSVEDAEFAAYGRILTGIDASQFANAAKEIPFVSEGSAYLASVPAFEALPMAKVIEEACFGTMDTQIGYCYGYSDTLNALEWHTSSEINVALTPLVLMLAKRSDLACDRMDSSLVKAFYLPRGTAIECYATTLHFCPCQVEDSGFSFVVALPRGTNTPLDAPTANARLFRRNKWLIAHDENAALLARGAVAGIGGENFKLRYKEN